MRLGRSVVLVCGREPLAQRVALGLGRGGYRARLLSQAELTNWVPGRRATIVLADAPDPCRLVTELTARCLGRHPRSRPLHVRIVVMHRTDPPPELPATDPASGLTVETFGIEPRAARVLLERWPLHFAMDPLFGQSPHLLVAGLAVPAKACVVQALRLIQYGEPRPCVTVLTDDPDTDAAAFEAAYPQAEQIADLRFRGLGSPDLAGTPKVTLALVSPSDPARDGLAVAREIARTIEQAHRASPPILLEIGDAEPLGGPGDWDGQIFPVSYLSEICRPEVLLEGVGDAVARTIHEHYCDSIAAQGRDPGSEPAGQPWERLASSYRQANRHQADHLWAKLAVTDCQAVPEDRVESFAFTPLEIERLAVIEHLRWAADRYMDGWSYAPERDNVRKHHPQLIPYADLSGPMKDLDRFAVRGVPTLLARSGLGIVRLLIVALPDPEPSARLDPGARRRMEAVLARLVERYPDRAVVFASTLAHPDVRSMVRLGLDSSRAGLLWLLTGPVSDLLAQQPDASARADLLELASRASRRVLLDGPQALRHWMARRAEILLLLGIDTAMELPAKRVALLQSEAEPVWSFEY